MGRKTGAPKKALFGEPRGEPEPKDGLAFEMRVRFGNGQDQWTRLCISYQDSAKGVSFILQSWTSERSLFKFLNYQFHDMILGDVRLSDQEHGIEGTDVV